MSKIPSDAIIASMSQRELQELADSLTTSDERDQLSDAILRINKAWRCGAHSERSDTRRMRRIRREMSTEHAPEMQARVDEDIIRRVIAQAYEAGLTPRQRTVWFYSDIIGWPQTRIADHLRIKQPAVSRILNRARAALWAHIDKHSPEYRVFVLESHRSAYFKPAHRPSLPECLDAPRQTIETIPGVSTHIQIDQPKRVEIWQHGDPVICTDEESREFTLSLTYRQVKAQAKNLKKLLQAM